MTGTAGKGVDETLEELLLPSLPPLSLLLLDSPQPVRGSSPSPMAGRLGPSHGHAITSSQCLTKAQSKRIRLYQPPPGTKSIPWHFPFYLNLGIWSQYSQLSKFYLRQRRAPNHFLNVLSARLPLTPISTNFASLEFSHFGETEEIQ